MRQILVEFLSFDHPLLAQTTVGIGSIVGTVAMILLIRITVLLAVRSMARATCRYPLLAYCCSLLDEPSLLSLARCFSSVASRRSSSVVSSARSCKFKSGARPAATLARVHIGDQLLRRVSAFQKCLSKVLEDSLILQHLVEAWVGGFVLQNHHHFVQETLPSSRQANTDRRRNRFPRAASLHALQPLDRMIETSLGRSVSAEDSV